MAKLFKVQRSLRNQIISIGVNTKHISNKNIRLKYPKLRKYSCNLPNSWVSKVSCGLQGVSAMVRKKTT